MWNSRITQLAFRTTMAARKIWFTLAVKQPSRSALSFDPNPLRRHTFWTLSIGGTFTWLGIYGVNQSVIQRCISCKTQTQARL